MHSKGIGKRKCIAVNGNPSHSYGVSLAIWDHIVLPGYPTQPYRPVLDLPTPEGWKAELT